MASTTYSFKDLVGSFSSPAAGTILLSGELGVGQVTVAYDTERTTHHVAADGAVMISSIPGNNGTLTFEMQQTSLLHQFLVGWANLLYTAQQLNDVSNWASATIALRSLLDGSTHIATGVSPLKIAEKTYAAAGANVRWELRAAYVVSQ